MIVIPIFIQAIYDFIGWYFIFKERSGHRLEWLYRSIKEILDFPITFIILYSLLNWSILDISCFYILKWFGACDGIYILFWNILNSDKTYPRIGLWWLWWTPLGIYRSIKATLLHKKITKGEITLQEFLFQIIVGIVIVFLIYSVNNLI